MRVISTRILIRGPNSRNTNGNANTWVDGLLCQYLQLKSRSQAPRLNVRNIKTWLDNFNHPIHANEVEFLEANDLISVARTEKAPLRSLFEQNVLLPTRGLYGIILSKWRDEIILQRDPMTTQADDEKIDLLVSVLIFLSAAIMLLIPLWVLSVMESIFHKLAVITIFVVAFLAFMTWATLARPFEILASTAGYVKQIPNSVLSLEDFE